jgi:hypothetical protein
VSLREALAIAFLLTVPCAASAQSQNPFFPKSYALVIGINGYQDPGFDDLTYAVKDAEGVAEFLREQGFEVTPLYQENATKTAILSAIEDRLAPLLTTNDRVVIFFAGHGMTRVVGSDERGYLVPYDATASSYGTMIPLTQLHDMSALMSNAKHQLFILDSCFGGLAALRASETMQVIDQRMPDYLVQVTRRKARQLLTAGGPDERVRDGGPDGHSLFTGHLLRALKEGVGDRNADGYITFSELFSYIQVAASDFYQTPGQGVLGGHELGDFLFLRPGYRANADTGMASPSVPSPTAPTVDVRAALVAGKQAFQAKRYQEARQLFSQVAKLGDAEGMEFLGKLLWEGDGGPEDQDAGVQWFVEAATRGRVGAMRNLIFIYSSPMVFPRWENRAEAERWRRALGEAEALQANLEIIDPSGQAGSGEPDIPPAATEVSRPSPPRFISAQ